MVENVFYRAYKSLVLESNSFAKQQTSTHKRLPNSKSHDSTGQRQKLPCLCCFSSQSPDANDSKAGNCNCHDPFAMEVCPKHANHVNNKDSCLIRAKSLRESRKYNNSSANQKTSPTCQCELRYLRPHKNITTIVTLRRTISVGQINV